MLNLTDRPKFQQKAHNKLKEFQIHALREKIIDPNIFRCISIRLLP